MCPPQETMTIVFKCRKCRLSNPPGKKPEGEKKEKVNNINAAQPYTPIALLKTTSGHINNYLINYFLSPFFIN